MSDYDHFVFHDWYVETEKAWIMNMKETCTYKILTNQFRDPALELFEDKTKPKNKIDWKKIFDRSKTEAKERHRVFVAGCRNAPPYPKLSALTIEQHLAGIKVLCAQNPNIFTMERIPRPTNYDFKVFESVKEIYLEEQKEFLEWAKKLWTSKHNIRALRPTPTTEMVYEAEFKMRASSLQSFPKHYEMAAHIALNDKTHKCEMIFGRKVIEVHLKDIPKVNYPDPILSKFIMPPCPVPEPCDKHPCWFILPNEKDMTELPLTEVHRELAQFALDSGAQIIASESALKCLMENDRRWTIPITVCDVVGPDGDKINILVLGSEFSTNRKSAMERTYRAFRHLLNHALMPQPKDTCPENDDHLLEMACGGESEMPTTSVSALDLSYSSDEDEGVLVINDDNIFDEPAESKLVADKETGKNTDKKGEQNQAKSSSKPDVKESDFYNCKCKGSIFEKPPPRSYTKWQLRNHQTKEQFEMIVHCSHKMRTREGELVAEPLVEYQIDLGGTRPAPANIRSSALSLRLRDSASLLNVRIDGVAGEIVTIDKVGLKDVSNEEIEKEIPNIIYETIYQLKSLLPGNYILQHETQRGFDVYAEAKKRALQTVWEDRLRQKGQNSKNNKYLNHGDNALLYATQLRGGDKLELDFNCSILAESDESKTVKNPPQLTDVLLPIHRFMKMLPCAFTPFEKMVVKEQKKPPVKKTAPPQAIRWPKRKQRKNKKKKASNVAPNEI